MNSNNPYVLVLGASIYDVFGFTDANYRPYNSNPGNIKMSHGGVCRNISENMARVGVNTKFITALGEDEKAKEMVDHADKMNFDMSHSLIVEGGCTPTYIAILDENGEMVSAIVDSKVLDHITVEFVEQKKDVIVGAEYVVVDADIPEVLEYMVKEYKGQTNFVLDPVSAPRAEKIRHLIPYFHTIKPNRHEAEVLCGFVLETETDLRRAGQYFIKKGIKNVFISLDEEGIYYKNAEQEGIIKTGKVEVINVTGAGDSFVAGLGYGYTNDMCIKDIVKFAMSMSVITISHEETIHPEMTYQFVKHNMSKIEWYEKEYKN